MLFHEQPNLSVAFHQRSVVEITDVTSVARRGVSLNLMNQRRAFCCTFFSTSEPILLEKLALYLSLTRMK